MRLADIATDPLLLPIWVPIAAGLVVWLIPRPAAALGKLMAVLATLFAAVWGVLVWTSPARLGVAAVKLPEFAWAGSWAAAGFLSWVPTAPSR